MSEKTVWVLEKKDGPWAAFLKIFFDDIFVRLIPYHDKAEISGAFSRDLPVMVFAEPSFLNLSLIQKIKVQKQTDPKFRVYLIGPSEPGKADPVFDAVFSSGPASGEFVKKWGETLPMPETVRLLVIDDEEEIVKMTRDYFEGRRSPSFEVRNAANGKEGLDAVIRERPDLVVLDIKMPVMDGREFYAELQRRKIKVPVIIFFDSISGEELTEIRKHGNPPVVEKGATASTLPALMQLVKKVIWFGGSR